jgi:miniconductance mechanosensitive channel
MLINRLIALGLTEAQATFANSTILILTLIIFALIANVVTKKILLRALVKIGKKTKNTWDDILIHRGVFNRLAHIAPATVLYWGTPLVFGTTAHITLLLSKFILAYMIIVTTSVILATIESINDIYQKYPISKDRPIKGYLQIVKLFATSVAIILVITAVLNINPMGILSGLGAMSAILLLVFKDSILGLVASINLAMNNMVRIGDWIEVPKYGADGDVIDTTLQSIIIQNFDKTIVSVPIYALISDSFKNWRGMSESGGRRIKRHINIDMTSVHFLSDAELTHFKEKSIISDYLSAKEIEILKYKESRVGKIATERRLTNLGTFRAYVKEYLRDNESIAKDMTFIVNQLPPSSEGIPIQIYVFSNNQEWAEYEDIQSDIFDHIIAILPEFGLKVFQRPTGADFQGLAPNFK